jgi:hypothetical protein
MLQERPTDIFTVGRAYVDYTATIDYDFLRTWRIPPGGIVSMDMARLTAIYKSLPQPPKMSASGSSANVVSWPPKTGQELTAS